MYLHYAFHGAALWAAVVSAFIPHAPHPTPGDDDGLDWKPLKVPRNAEAFQLPPKPVDFDAMNDMHVKRIPPPVCILEHSSL